jgi:hypothetical protein
VSTSATLSAISVSPSATSPPISGLSAPLRLWLPVDRAVAVQQAEQGPPPSHHSHHLLAYPVSVMLCNDAMIASRWDSPPHPHTIQPQQAGHSGSDTRLADISCPRSGCPGRIRSPCAVADARTLTIACRNLLAAHPTESVRSPDVLVTRCRAAGAPRFIGERVHVTCQPPVISADRRATSGLHD